MKLLPSLLYPEFESFSHRFAECLTVGDEVHVDFADGIFVGNTLPKVLAVSTLEGDIEIEAHLMVEQPDGWIDEAIEDERFARIIIHAEAKGDIEAMLQRIQAKGRKAGIALKPETPVEAIVQWSKHIDQVLILMVDPGFNGSPFQPEAVGKIGQVRQLLPGVEVSVDGGIRPETLPLVVKAGADRAAIGSFLHDKSLKDGLELLRGIVAKESS